MSNKFNKFRRVRLRVVSHKGVELYNKVMDQWEANHNICIWSNHKLGTDLWTFHVEDL